MPRLIVSPLCLRFFSTRRAPLLFAGRARDKSSHLPSKRSRNSLKFSEKGSRGRRIMRKRSKERRQRNTRHGDVCVGVGIGDRERGKFGWYLRESVAAEKKNKTKNITMYRVRRPATSKIVRSGIGAATGYHEKSRNP